MPILLRYTITFTGTVQGVGFRYTTESIARQFAVEGWVCNEPDGSVKCVAEGQQAELDRFLAAVKEAMSRHIRETRVARSTATGEFRGFSIRRFT